MKDYFSILGVGADASDAEIKRVYRSLAMKHHPDRGGDQSKFQEIQEAYDVLSNPQKRAEWEQLKNMHHGNPFGAGGFAFHVNSGGFDINDFLFRGFGAGPFGDFQQRVPKNRDLRVMIELDLASTLEPQTKHISVRHLNNNRETITIEIPRGINSNMQMKFAERGDRSQANLPPGDLYVDFRVQPHKDFAIEGIDLVRVIKLNCLEAVTGTSLKITTLDGKVLSWSVPVGTQHLSRFRIQNHGLWAVDQPIRGSLIIQVELEVPRNLDTAQLLTIEKIINELKVKNDPH